MDSVSPTNNVKRRYEQFPVDVKVRGIRFETDSGDLLRIVVMSGNTTPLRASFHEYHHGNSSVLVDSVNTLMMHSTQIERSDQAIDSFAQGLPAPLDIPQVVQFVCGIQSTTGAKCRLYKATDPDDPTKKMGLLIEQDNHGNLERVTWYKAWEANAAFLAVPEQLEFQLVKDETGAPSVDPNKIGGWTWYFSTTIGIGLSAPSVKA